MTANESQDIQEGQFATLEQLKQYFRKIGRSEAEAAAAWQRGYRGRATPAVPRTPPVKHWQDINEDTMMGKIESTGKIVRIIRKQHSVKFSDQKDWLLIDTDPEKGNQGAGLKWLPASTRFEWVRPYRETVDEAFDQPYPLHWASPRDDTVLAMTKLNDGSPLVIRFDSEGDHWQVVFDRNSSFEVTGEGDAQRIFATVLSAIGQFVKEHQPQSLTFSASKDVDTGSANPESRAKLYNRLVQRYASSVGYKVHSREQGDEVVYLLRPNTVTTEATYPGNIGMMEVSKFFNIATPEEKIKFKQLKDAGETSKAWRLIQQVIGVKLQGNEFAEQISKDGKDSAQAWIDKVYDQYPQWPYGQADRVMVWGDGEDEQFAAFKLKPGTGANTVAIDWIMAGPEQRQGVGSRAIKELQRLAQTDGIKLTLYPWAKGQISQASLIKLYKRHGFQPVTKGAAPMAWDPAQAVDENFADGRNPQDKGDSQRHGIPKGATMAQLEKAAKASGRKGQLARWQINMRRGKKK
jgi:GNAT superfamily N-acetyltransferase